MNYNYLSELKDIRSASLRKPETIKVRSVRCFMDTNRTSAGRFLAIGVLMAICQRKPLQLWQTHSVKCRYPATVPLGVAEQAVCLFKLQWSPEKIADKLRDTTLQGSLGGFLALLFLWVLLGKRYFFVSAFASCSRVKSLLRI
jgi:hypothetical protein